LALELSAQKGSNDPQPKPAVCSACGKAVLVSDEVGKTYSLTIKWDPSLYKYSIGTPADAVLEVDDDNSYLCDCGSMIEDLRVRGAAAEDAV